MGLLVRRAPRRCYAPARAGARQHSRRPANMGPMDHNYVALEIFFISLLAVASLGMAGFAALVVARLFKGQK
ncbi:hypothetical protein GCM10023081_10060 [Arthrobacter ginkgonis]